MHVICSAKNSRDATKRNESCGEGGAEKEPVPVKETSQAEAKLEARCDKLQKDLERSRQDNSVLEQRVGDLTSQVKQLTMEKEARVATTRSAELSTHFDFDGR